VRIARSKTDPAGEAMEIGLPRGKNPETCPVRAFQAWAALVQMPLSDVSRNDTGQ
jgi:hypothetical protein